MPEAARTLVKSPPELWAEVSDPESLARHLGEVGEIKITRLEPESTVAWEGDRIRGTVDLAPAGWGTKVTVTAEPVEAPDPPEAAEPAAEPEPEPEPEPVAVEPPAEEPEPAPEPQAAERRGFFARFFRKRAKPIVEDEPQAEPAPVGVVEPETEAEPEAEPATTEAVTVAPPESQELDTEAVLDGMLGSLGSAHHRPFSR